MKLLIMKFAPASLNFLLRLMKLVCVCVYAFYSSYIYIYIERISVTANHNFVTLLCAISESCEM